MLPAWLTVDLRPGPSANVLLVQGVGVGVGEGEGAGEGEGGAVLVDCGAGTRASDARLDAFLAGHGLRPGDLALLVTTHWHADHVGGAARLQREHGVAIAGGAPEAALLAAGDPRAHEGDWLAWTVAPYGVDRPLQAGDVVTDAGPALHVVPTPGQTPGHLALWEPEDRILLTGDLLQRHDVGWMPTGGPWAAGAADTLIASVERLAALDARVAVPGHGPPVEDVPDAVARSLERYRRWREDPEPAAWHTARRAFVSLAMLEVLPLAGLHERMERTGWIDDLAGLTGASPAAVVDRLVAELTGSGALLRRDGALAPAMAFEPRG